MLHRPQAVTIHAWRPGRSSLLSWHRCSPSEGGAVSQWFMVFWTSTNPILCLRFLCSVICNSNRDTLRQSRALLPVDVLPNV